jgi:integrase
VKVEENPKTKKAERPKTVFERPATLTPANIGNYRANEDHRLISDPLTQGLYLTIGPKPRGTMSWLMRIRRPNGKMGKVVLGRLDTTGRELKVGEVPTIGGTHTLLGARSLSADIHRRRAEGIDVIADHKAAKSRKRSVAVDRASNAFAHAVANYAENYLIKETGERPRTWRKTARLLGLQYPDGDDGEPTVIANGLCDRWAHKALREIDGPLVRDLINDARRTGVPGLKAKKRNSENRARQLFVALGSLFSWLQDEGDIDVNPCSNVRTPAAAIKRDRWLNGDEIKVFWRACDELGAPFGSIYKLCLLTGCRLTEVTKMTRAELSADLSTLSLAGSRTKNKLPHVVPLSKLAQSIIADVPRIEGPYVFTVDGTAPVRVGSRHKEQLDKIMTKIAGHPIEPSFRIHDLRRTFASGCSEHLDIRPDVIELSINHVSGARASVAGNYNRSTMMPQRKAAMELWANHIGRLVTGKSAKVVPFGKGHGRGQH